MSAVPADGGVVVQMPLFSSGQARAAVLHHDVHAISIPARAFTGDFYFTHREDDGLWFALGDVAGKGLPAALVMAMIQEELEHRIVSCATTGCDPAITMSRLHTFLKPLVARNRFATAVIGNLNTDGVLALTNAGHCPPLIVRANGQIEEVASTGPVLGILASSEWRTFRTRLAPRETVVLYSDGAVEARSSDGEEFGVRRIAAALSAGAPKEIAEGIVAAVERHSGGVREDDLTVVVVRRG